jgi:hypothetical protein
MSQNKGKGQGKKKGYSKGKAAAARRAKNRRVALIAVGIVAAAAVVAVLFALSGTKGSKQSSGTTQASPVSASVMTAVSGVPQTTMQSVGAGLVNNPPKATPSGTPSLTSNGLPEFLYVGAEYCPYCAAERWSMVQALTRFGTFQGLKETTSSSTDVFANTPTFSFYGSTYTSKYLVFTPVETQDRTGGRLETPTAAQQQILSTYNKPPYVPSASTNAIPFLDIAGEFIGSGASFSPTVIQGMTMQQIASSLANGQNKSSQGVVGSANYLTAAICKATNNQPSNVCSPSYIQTLESQLGG